MYRCPIVELLGIHVECEVLPFSRIERDPFFIQVIDCFLEVLLTVFQLDKCAVVFPLGNPYPSSATN
jgi:hypothetical protein